MKYLVFSDLHGSITAFEKIEQIFLKEKCDAYLFLGDLLYHGPRNPLPEGYNPKLIAEKIRAIKVPFIWIKGNCDAEVDEMVTAHQSTVNETLKIDSHTIFCTHGHHLTFNENDLNQISDSNVVLYGHYHVYRQSRIGNTVFINIGSCSLPKDSRKQYAIIDKKITIYDWNDQKIGEYVL